MIARNGLTVYKTCICRGVLDKFYLRHQSYHLLGDLSIPKQFLRRELFPDEIPGHVKCKHTFLRPEAPGNPRTTNLAVDGTKNADLVAERAEIGVPSEEDIGMRVER